MARKKKHPEHVNHERWLVSYADFITLLFAFFVVLYASSQVDKKKMGNLANSIQEAFQELGVFEASSTKVPQSELAAIAEAQALKNTQKPISIAAQMKALQSELEKALAPEISKHTV